MFSGVKVTSRPPLSTKEKVSATIPSPLFARKRSRDSRDGVSTSANPARRATWRTVQNMSARIWASGGR